MVMKYYELKREEQLKLAIKSVKDLYKLSEMNINWYFIEIKEYCINFAKQQMHNEK